MQNLQENGDKKVREEEKKEAKGKDSKRKPRERPDSREN